MVATFLSQPLVPLTQDLQTVWQSLTPLCCPRKYNFHLHTSCSDGQMEPEELIEQAVQWGLFGLAITDHHSIQGYHRAQRWLEDFVSTTANPNVPALWSGIEITSNLFDTEVHILGYGFDPQGGTMTPYLSGKCPKGCADEASQVIKAIQQAGGLAVLAHPARYRQPASRLIPQAAQLGIDAVEAYYAYGNPKPWVSSIPQMTEILYLSELYNLACTCGTDSHGDSILYRL